MIPINFFKRHAEHLHEFLTNGKPIEPIGQWDSDKILALAGACFHAVASMGPKEDAFFKSKGIEVSERHPEQREARVVQFNEEMHHAVQFYSELAALVHQNRYDEMFEEEVGAVLFIDTDDKPQVQPVLGFKQPPNGPDAGG